MATSITATFKYTQIPDTSRWHALLPPDLHRHHALPRSLQQSLTGLPVFALDLENLFFHTHTEQSVKTEVRSYHCPIPQSLMVCPPGTRIKNQGHYNLHPHPTLRPHLLRNLLFHFFPASLASLMPSNKSRSL